MSARRVRKSKQEMLISLARVVMDNPNASLEKLAEAIGTSRGTLYRIASSRDELIDLLRAYVVEVIDTVINEANLDNDDDFERSLSRLAEGFLDYADLCLFSAADHYFPLRNTKDGETSVDIEANYRLRMEKFFLRGQEKGAFRVDLPANWLVYSFDHLLQAASEGKRNGTIASALAHTMVCKSFLSGARTPTKSAD